MVKLFFGFFCLTVAYAQSFEQALDSTYFIHEVVLNSLYEFYYDNWIVITAVIGSLAFGFFIGKKHEKQTDPKKAQPTTSQGTTTEYIPQQPCSPITPSARNSNSSSKGYIRPVQSRSKRRRLSRNSNYKIDSPSKCNSEEVVEKMLISGKFHSNFDQMQILGQGGFGTVFKVSHFLEEKLYAVKIVPIRFIAGMTLRNHSLLREILAMTKLNSPHVVKYVTCWLEQLESGLIPDRDDYDSSSYEEDEDSDSFNSNTIKEEEPQQNNKVGLFIQMEYCAGMPLDKYLGDDRRTIDRHLNFNLFESLLKGIVYIHTNGIVHRDIKPANLFVEDGSIKIGDFGLAKENPKTNSLHMVRVTSINNLRQSANVGTPHYIAPEQQGTRYNHKVDIFPLGLILCELHMKFSTHHEKSQHFHDIKTERRLPEGFAEEYPIETKLVLWLTERSPQARPDASEILESEYMAAWKTELKYTSKWNPPVLK